MGRNPICGGDFGVEEGRRKKYQPFNFSTFQPFNSQTLRVGALEGEGTSLGGSGYEPWRVRVAASAFRVNVHYTTRLRQRMQL